MISSGKGLVIHTDGDTTIIRGIGDECVEVKKDAVHFLAESLIAVLAEQGNQKALDLIRKQAAASLDG